MKKVLFSIVALMTIFLSACTKEEDDADIDVSKNIYLYDSYWQITSILHNANYGDENSPTIETLDNFNQCYRDNIYFFEAEGNVFGFDENYLKCNANDPQQVTYNYSISNNDSYFKAWMNPEDPDNSIYLDGTIKTINIKEFKIEKIIVDASGLIDYKLYTFKAINKKPKN